jgi:hypothetical protein
MGNGQWTIGNGKEFQGFFLFLQLTVGIIICHFSPNHLL